MFRTSRPTCRLPVKASGTAGQAAALPDADGCRGDIGRGREDGQQEGRFLAQGRGQEGGAPLGSPGGGSTNYFIGQMPLLSLTADAMSRADLKPNVMRRCQLLASDCHYSNGDV